MTLLPIASALSYIGPAHKLAVCEWLGLACCEGFFNGQHTGEIVFMRWPAWMPGDLSVPRELPSDTPPRRVKHIDANGKTRWHWEVVA